MLPVGEADAGGWMSTGTCFEDVNRNRLFTLLFDEADELLVEGRLVVSLEGAGLFVTCWEEVVDG